MLQKEKAAGVRSITNNEPAEARRLAEIELARSKRVREPVGKVEDRTIAGPGGKLGVRVYWPKAGGDRVSMKRLPVFVYFHGGGFVAGSVEDMDAACRRLTNRSGYIVISVDYRLAPEGKFPAAVEDCYAAVCWAKENAGALGADASSLVVGGSSAGGNLAAVVCALSRDRRGPKIVRQVLVYPVTDVTRSLRKYSKCGFGPTEVDMKWCYRHYLNTPEDAKNPLASPLLGDVHGVPPATVVMAEYDTLNEQIDDHLAKLKEAGVKVTRKEFAGMTHGFIGSVDSLDSAGEAIAWVAADLKKATKTRA
jgi:acetyl esterase